MKKILYCIAALIITVSCVNRRAQNSEMLSKSNGVADSTVNAADNPISFNSVDLDKSYPSKRVTLEEIAEVRYVALETNDQSIIGTINGIALRDSLIVITDTEQDEILFFTDNGRFISKISHKGAGPEDYIGICNSCVDFDRKVVYVEDFDATGATIKVYNFDGTYNRKFSLQELGRKSIEQMYLADNDNIIIAISSTFSDIYGEPDHIPYYKIDVRNGSVEQLDIEVESPGITAMGRFGGGENGQIISFPFYAMHKVGKDVVISDFTHPIAYIYRDGRLHPVLERKGGKPHSPNEAVISSITALTNRYMFIEQITTSIDRKNFSVAPSDGRVLMVDRRDGTIVEIDDVCTGSRDKNVSIKLWNNDVPENMAVLSTMMYEYAIMEELGNHLHGKLKTLVDELDEEANPILTILRFK